MGHDQYFVLTKNFFFLSEKTDLTCYFDLLKIKFGEDLLNFWYQKIEKKTLVIIVQIAS
jgi:hypothetical protein